MTRKEIKENQTELDMILNTVDKETDRVQKLIPLARKVGASSRKGPHGDCVAGEPELVDNIQRALQTASMIDMCEISAKNYKIALIAAIIALLSTVATWITIFSR
jgi:5-enolpyruvylshikimate-3-phosphate synthase